MGVTRTPHTVSSSLKGTNKPAQGNALGMHRNTTRALKGRDIAREIHPDVPPFQGCVDSCVESQGVALGWLVSPL